jgi:hypothetical protein
MKCQYSKVGTKCPNGMSSFRGFGLKQPETNYSSALAFLEEKNLKNITKYKAYYKKYKMVEYSF